MQGFIDLITDTGVVVDYKTVKRSKNQAEVDADLQLSLYAYLAGVKKVAFISFVKKKVPDVQLIESTRTMAQKKWAMRVLARSVDGIEKGFFPLADPTHWICSDKYCDFWSKCRGKTV